MLCKGLVECRSHVAACSCVFAEIGSCYITGDVIAEVSASGLLKGLAGANVNFNVVLELNLRAVEDAGDSAEGEHKVHILRPSLLAALIAVFFLTVGTVVVRINIHYVVG